MPLRKEIYVVYGRVFVRYIRGVGNITTISWTESEYMVFANQGRKILKLNPYKMAFPQFFGAVVGYQELSKTLDILMPICYRLCYHSP